MSDQQSNEELIKERQANLPLPEQPPVAPPAGGSADASTTSKDVGYGGSRSDDFSAGGEGNSGLREPATGGSAVRDDGLPLKENTVGMGVGRVPGGIPSDATSGGKVTEGEVETRVSVANPEAIHSGDP